MSPYRSIKSMHPVQARYAWSDRYGDRGFNPIGPTKYVYPIHFESHGTESRCGHFDHYLFRAIPRSLPNDKHSIAVTGKTFVLRTRITWLTDQDDGTTELLTQQYNSSIWEGSIFGFGALSGCGFRFPARRWSSSRLWTVNGRSSKSRRVQEPSITPHLIADDIGRTTAKLSYLSFIGALGISAYTSWLSRYDISSGCVG
jgi:hypothetical protein